MSDHQTNPKTLQRSRRQFLEFLGKGTLTVAASGILLEACQPTSSSKVNEESVALTPTFDDKLDLLNTLDFEVLIKWKDQISPKDYFGFNNDYLAFIPLDKKSHEGILWANHEYIHQLFVSEYDGSSERTKAQVDQERYAVGGSLLHIRQKENVSWEVVHDSGYNRRITGTTKIPFNWHEEIKGSSFAIGTLGNCAGGVTPWGTILTCEENYDGFYGERAEDGKAIIPSGYGWEKFYPNPPEHYGWVVEVDPLTGTCQKHIALGRCAHECATVKELPDGRVVVYTGDDKNDECLYKFISSKPQSLLDGTLYVANLEQGRWESLDLNERPELQKHFSSQTEVLIQLRKASKLVGGTKLDRPEDIEIDPISGAVFITLTNNKPKGNYFGSILKVEEQDGQYDALSFTSDTFLAGGEETGFACPDNIAFDKAGNLWFASDISGRSIGNSTYQPFGNNGLFVVPRSGDHAGEVLQIGSAPKDAELTGLCFSPDGKTLFLSVQHPGELTTDLRKPTSNWPEGGSSKPKPSVVTIQGDFLTEIQGLS